MNLTKEQIDAATNAALNIAEALSSIPETHPLFSRVNLAAVDMHIAGMPAPAQTPAEASAHQAAANEAIATNTRNAQIVHAVLQLLPLVEQIIVPGLKLA